MDSTCLVDLIHHLLECVTYEFLLGLILHELAINTLMSLSLCLPVIFCPRQNTLPKKGSSQDVQVVGGLADDVQLTSASACT